MSWELVTPFDGAHRAALERGNPLVYVTPPAGWTLRPLWSIVPMSSEPGTLFLVIVPDTSVAEDVAAVAALESALGPVHRMGGQALAGRMLRSASVRTLVATPSDALSLAQQAGVNLTRAVRVAVCWPELLPDDETRALEAVMSEVKDAGRILVTGEETAVTDLIERYAHRAPVAVYARPPAAPLGPVRYLVADSTHRERSVRSLLEAMNPDSGIVWEPLTERSNRWDWIHAMPGIRLVTNPGDLTADLAIAVDLPVETALAALRAAAREVVVLVGAAQLPMLGRLAQPMRPARIESEADRSRTRATHLRRRIRERLNRGGLDAELLVLDPLFDEFDPALVAAAALASAEAPAPAAPPADAWVRLHVGIGNRDRVRPADLVGALVNGVGLPKDRIGRVEIRDGFSLIEVNAEDAERAISGLTGMTVRSRRVVARRDRK